MKTVLQDIIQWTIENAFNVEAQDGTTYIAIDHEEMRTKFDEWLEKEQKQIINAYDQDLYGGINGYRKFENGAEYFTETFNAVD